MEASKRWSLRSSDGDDLNEMISEIIHIDHLMDHLKRNFSEHWDHLHKTIPEIILWMYPWTCLSNPLWRHNKFHTHTRAVRTVYLSQKMCIEHQTCLHRAHLTRRLSQNHVQTHRERYYKLVTLNGPVIMFHVHLNETFANKVFCAKSQKKMVVNEIYGLQ